MKKIFTLAAIALIAATTQAQIVSSNSTKITTIQTEKVKKESNDYNRLYFGYANMSFHGDAEDIDVLHGFSLGYAHASNLVKQLPLYLEYGGEIVFNKNEYDKAFALDIPVNLTYKVASDKGFYVAPYAGIAFRFNIIGKEEGYYDDDDDIDWFDDMDFKRFQFGGQIGVNFGYKALNLGIGYRMFTPIYKESYDGKSFKMNTHSFSATLGFNF